MNVAEMSNRFDVLYDNADQEAPGMNSYEKSIYLTKSANSIAESITRGITQKGSTGLLNDEFNRDSVRDLLQDYTVGNYTGVDVKKLSNTIASMKSSIFKYPLNLLSIDSDFVLIPIDGNKDNSILTPIKPIRKVDLVKIHRDPYKKLNDIGVVKVDANDNDGIRYCEVFYDVNTDYTLDSYRLSYYKRPEPIIIESLDNSSGPYAGLNLSIQGETEPYVATTGDPATNVGWGLHERIVEDAVKLAILHYRENTLQANVQLDEMGRKSIY